MTLTPKFRIAIIGGGIGGATLASSLARFEDIRLDVYERNESFQTEGAGLAITRRVKSILDQLGIGEKLEDNFSSFATTKVSIWKSDQTQAVVKTELNASQSQLHRKDLLDIVTTGIPADRIHFSHQLVSYEENATGVILLTFASGRTAECDVLIGCDGVRSPVRQCLFSGQGKELEKHIDPVWTGTVAYRALVAKARLPGDHPPLVPGVSIHCGKNSSVIQYPVRRGELLNTLVLRTELDKRGTQYQHPSAREISGNEISKWYLGWDARVSNVVKAVETATIWAIYMLDPLPYFARGRVALAGDAAHAMEPYLAAGANSAIEDALVLTILLAHPQCTIENVHVALRTYSEYRQPRANELLAHSTRSGELQQYRGTRFDPRDVAESFLDSDGIVNDEKRAAAFQAEQEYMGGMPVGEDIIQTVDAMLMKALKASMARESTN